MTLVSFAADGLSRLAKNPTAIVAVFILQVAVLIRYFSGNQPEKHGLKSLPGPRGLPFIGPARELSQRGKTLLWVKYAEWAKTYGDVYMFEVLGTKTVVLNSAHAVTELLGRRSWNYSDRPELPMAVDYAGWGWNMGFIKRGEEWRSHRRIFQQSFTGSLLPNYYPIQRRSTRGFVRSVLEDPENFFKNARSHSGGILLEIIYGYKTREEQQAHVKMADRATVGLAATGNHGSFLVDYFPVLKLLPAWMPGGGYKSQGKEWADMAEELKDRPWRQIKEAIKNGVDIPPSFCTKNIEKFGISLDDSESNVRDEDGLDLEDIVKSVAGISFVGGVDTSVSALLSFILAMQINPKAQARAREEIDAVMAANGGNLPDFDDRDQGKLPYVEAILWEVVRWKPVSPVAVSHYCINDDVFDGYFIPGGTAVVGNMWPILHNEKLYGPEPYIFNPDRFMPDGKEDGWTAPPDPRLYSFGYGRRICPGRHLAWNTLWLTMVYLLATVEIKRPIDGQGKEIDQEVEYSDGLISHPHPFEARFITRSPAAVKRIQEVSDFE